jgi:hypothetical protein
MKTNLLTPWIKVIFLTSVFFLLAGCKKGNNSNTAGYINAIVNGVQYNCINANGAPSFNNDCFGVVNPAGCYEANYETTTQLPNYEFSIVINSNSALNGINLPFTFSNNYTAPGIEIFFYHNQATSPTQTEYYCNNWAMNLTAAITSMSNNTIQGTFNGSFYYDLQNSNTYVPVQNGTFSCPYNP